MEEVSEDWSMAFRLAAQSKDQRYGDVGRRYMQMEAARGQQPAFAQPHMIPHLFPSAAGNDPALAVSRRLDWVRLWAAHAAIHMQHCRLGGSANQGSTVDSDYNRKNIT